MMASRAVTAGDISRALRAEADPAQAKFLAGFFKTGPGDYGEGDRFLGLKVPIVRRVVREFSQATLAEAMKLIASSMHEERLAGLLVMVQQSVRAGVAERQRIRRLYLSMTRHINNWDLVDLSAPQIVGESLSPDRIALLRRLARSQSVWERRISILTTFAFIRRGRLEPTLEICGLLVNDRHDLIHKACGWMLREVGKRDPGTLKKFLASHAGAMPRTMLRYAIERLEEPERRRYMTMKSRAGRIASREVERGRFRSSAA